MTAVPTLEDAIRHYIDGLRAEGNGRAPVMKPEEVIEVFRHFLVGTDWMIGDLYQFACRAAESATRTLQEPAPQEVGWFAQGIEVGLLYARMRDEAKAETP